MQGVFSLPFPMGESYFQCFGSFCYDGCFFSFSFWGKHLKP